MALEENKDLDSLKIEDLVGSLQTYEANYFFQTRMKKSLALKASTNVGKKCSDPNN